MPWWPSFACETTNLTFAKYGRARSSRTTALPRHGMRSRDGRARLLRAPACSSSVPRDPPVTEARRPSARVGRLELRCEAEVGEGPLAVPVDHEPRDLAVAHVEDVRLLCLRLP